MEKPPSRAFDTPEAQANANGLLVECVSESEEMDDICREMVTQGGRDEHD